LELSNPTPVVCKVYLKAKLGAVRIQTLSAVIIITRLVFSTLPRLGCLYNDGNLFNPTAKFLKVILRLKIKPLLESCSRTEQQLHMLHVGELRLYLPRIVMNVVKPARVYPIAHAIDSPERLNPNKYNPVFSPIQPL
jgi:hypothetical protein